MIRKSLRHVVTALVLLIAVADRKHGHCRHDGRIERNGARRRKRSSRCGSARQYFQPLTNRIRHDGRGRALRVFDPATGHLYGVGDQDRLSGHKRSGQSVFADTTQTVAIRISSALRTIAHVAATSGGSLVKAGTTSDVYSVNSTMQKAAATLGGGGSLNSAYSAVASVPGAYVPMNQTGYYQTITIRGGDFDQVGYEFDGVPINRSFDNYPSGSASSLGNAEVQVYTGSSPANSERPGSRRLYQPGHQDRYVSRLCGRAVGRRNADVLPPRRSRVRRFHTGPFVLVLCGHRGIQPRLPLPQQSKRLRL